MLTPIFTPNEAMQADNARRAGRLDDPQLKKLGDLSVSMDVDVQRIWLQTQLCSEYLNLHPAYMVEQSDPKHRDSSVMNRLEDIWNELSYQEEKALQTVDLSPFHDASFDTARFAEIPILFRKDLHSMAGGKDYFFPRVPRLFQPETSFNSFRTEEENRILGTLKKAYETIQLNDPKHEVVTEMHELLRDFGVPLD